MRRKTIVTAYDSTTRVPPLGGGDEGGGWIVESEVD
jgi:hypothetical protein